MTAGDSTGAAAQALPPRPRPPRRILRVTHVGLVELLLNRHDPHDGRAHEQGEQQLVLLEETAADGNVDEVGGVAHEILESLAEPLAGF